MSLVGTCPRIFVKKYPNGPDWVDLKGGAKVRITKEPPVGKVIAGLIAVRSYGDIAREHAERPELKFGATDGGACLRRTRGTLSRQRVRVLWREHLGKEGNLLERRAEGTAVVEEVQQLYVDRRGFTDRVVPILRQMPAHDVASSAGVTEMALREILSLRSSPRADVRVALIRTALRSPHYLHMQLEQRAAAS